MILGDGYGSKLLEFLLALYIFEGSIFLALGILSIISGPFPLADVFIVVGNCTLEE